MPEWWTYGLSDFLMFSPRVYHRLLAATNAALWPAQIGTILLGLAAAVLTAVPRRGRERVLWPVLGLLWMVVAWAFLWERYAVINWGALYAVPAFVLQGVLLIGAGLFGAVRLPTSRDRTTTTGAVLLVAIVLGWPLLAPLSGRPIETAEVFGLFPDPTALATIVLLACGRGGLRWILMIIPVAWALIAAATLFTLGSWIWTVVIVAGGAAVALALTRPTTPSPRRS
ncbi:DUF6064 family protein [Rhodoplanes roseus]|uniref:MFS transporter permease n=1 Tax=Rhodoplanes roseus TaxID=29409 RepID=A0A327L4Y7_9BRAD|nr:DUF6064 family protein [Rhodoplanes roseus]RAI42748.1 hypothetical protein CH341_17860 [Rhodoplanes roseus]